MDIVQINQEDGAALREIAEEIPLETLPSEKIDTLIKEMSTALRKEADGVALAAPQVGVSLRLFVVRGYLFADVAEDDRSIPDVAFINPVITKTSQEVHLLEEGCLSVRGVWGVAPRFNKVTLVAYSPDGKKITRGASGLIAHIFQHEIDHLDGTLFIDKATELHEKH
jgi:peptide deformylase